MMKKNHGVLLVEALLSVLILGVAITASVRSFAYAGKTHQLTKNYLNALRLAEEKMAELEALPELEEGETSDAFKDPGHGFSWNLNIEPLHPPTEEDQEKEPSVKYLKTHLRVKWGAEERSVTLDTILIKKEEEEDEEGSEETPSEGAYAH